MPTGLGGYMRDSGGKRLDEFEVAPRVVPPTVAATLGILDPRTSVYNLKPYHLYRTRAALAKARAGVGSFKLAVAGDSTVRGVGATPGVSGWPEQLVARLAALGYPLAGSGLVAGWAGSNYDARVTLGAGWAPLTGASSLIRNSTTTNAAVFASATPSTNLTVYFSNGSGPFSVTIDGGAPTVITPPGGNSPGSQAFTGLSNINHSVSITRSSGQALIFGVEFGVGNGIRLYNAGVGGEKIFNGNSWYQTDNYASAAAGFNADLVGLMFETNDAPTSGGAETGYATYKTRVGDSIARVKANTSDFFLIAAVPSNTKDFTQYQRALYELADENDVPLVDLQHRMGTYTLSNSYGLMFDNLHPTAAGYAVVADTILVGLGLI